MRSKRPLLSFLGLAAVVLAAGWWHLAEDAAFSRASIDETPRDSATRFLAVRPDDGHWDAEDRTAQGSWEDGKVWRMVRGSAILVAAGVLMAVVTVGGSRPMRAVAAGMILLGAIAIAAKDKSEPDSLRDLRSRLREAEKSVKAASDSWSARLKPALRRYVAEHSAQSVKNISWDEVERALAPRDTELPALRQSLVTATFTRDKLAAAVGTAETLTSVGRDLDELTSLCLVGLGVAVLLPWRRLRKLARDGPTFAAGVAALLIALRLLSPPTWDTRPSESGWLWSLEHSDLSRFPSERWDSLRGSVNRERMMREIAAIAVLAGVALWVGTRPRSAPGATEPHGLS